MDNEALLASKLEKLFPESGDRLEATALLDSYGQEPYEQEQTRVRLAILKLAGHTQNITEIKNIQAPPKPISEMFCLGQSILDKVKNGQQKAQKNSN